jgi:hypothetical protein
MRQFRIRVFISASQYQDMVLSGDTCWIAESLGKGMSPVGRAQLLGEAY